MAFRGGYKGAAEDNIIDNNIFAVNATGQAGGICIPYKLWHKKFEKLHNFHEWFESLKDHVDSGATERGTISGRAFVITSSLSFRFQ